jgi:hypothetical protein
MQQAHSVAKKQRASTSELELGGAAKTQSYQVSMQPLLIILIISAIK